MSETVRDPVANPWHGGQQQHGLSPHTVRAAWRGGQVGGLAAAAKAVAGGKLTTEERAAAEGTLTALVTLLAEPDNGATVHLLASILERQNLTAAVAG